MNKFKIVCNTCQQTGEDSGPCVLEIEIPEDSFSLPQLCPFGLGVCDWREE